MAATKQFSWGMKNHFNFDAELRKRRVVTYPPRQITEHRQETDIEMRTLSFVFAFVLAGTSLAGSPDGGLPGNGTFAYSSPPIVSVAPSIIVIVSLRRR